jgi:membrane-bound lytic murein transglycosylase D
MVQLGLPEILNRPYFATIDTEKAMDVKTAARMANMSLQDFLILNPSHNRPVIKADSAVVLPADKLDIFRSNLERNAAPLTEWQTYTLKHGEKLDKVAPRFGIALPDLLRINGLPAKVRLGAGSTLLVPAGDGADDLANLRDAPALSQIIEPEPVVQSRGRLAKSGSVRKSAKAGDKSDTKLGSKVANSPNKRLTKGSSGKDRQVAGASTGKTSGKTAKAGSTKAATTPKLAKSDNGRRN